MATKSEVKTALLEALDENNIKGPEAEEIANDQMELLHDVLPELEDDDEEAGGAQED